MELIWRGHSCFVLQVGGFRLMLDPYKEVTGLPDIAGDTVDAVLCSHGHRDHCYTDELHVLGGTVPFGCERVSTFHDGEGGALRRINTVHRLTAEGVTVVHLGDLGHRLTTEQLAALTPCDVLLLPVGGTYTVDHRQAKAVMEQIRPRVTVPMHYRDGERGYEVLEPVETFLAQFSPDLVRRYGSNTLTLAPDMPKQIAVLTYQG